MQITVHLIKTFFDLIPARLLAALELLMALVSNIQDANQTTFSHATQSPSYCKYSLVVKENFKKT